MDLFYPEFKRLRAKRPLPDFSDVVDIDNIQTKKSQHRIDKIKLDNRKIKPVSGLKPCDEWNVFKFPDYPGFIMIQNPFQNDSQHYWVSRCLQDFSSDKRNSTNLSNLGCLDHYSAWEDFVSKQMSTFTKDDPLWKLRWATLGYHYGWQTKEYSEDRKGEFPRDVQCLSQYFSHCLGLGPFRAEAGIVNYYRLDSTLGVHTDHSEIDHDAPLLSFSFGRSCVFLLGGPTKETKPMAIFLRDGDVCVMSKEARLAHHAVPKILPPDVDLRLLQPGTDNVGNGVDTTDSYSCPSVQNDDSRGTVSTSECGEIENSQTSNANGCASENDLRNGENSGHKHTDSPVERNCSFNNVHNKSTEFPISEEYLSYIDTLNGNIESVLPKLDWKSFEVYLKSSRINLNMRQVLPPGCEIVEPKETGNISSQVEGYY